MGNNIAKYVFCVVTKSGFVCFILKDSTCTATLVATKGVYILAFLLDLSKMAVIRQTQALSQHVIPPTSKNVI